MSLILARLLPFLLTAGLAGTAGGWLTHRADSIPYNRLQAQYSAFQAQTANDRATAEKAARDAEDQEFSHRLLIERNNDHVMQDLTDQLASASADRDFANRLLTVAQARTSSSPKLSQAADRSGADGAAGASGDRYLVTELGNAAIEARTCLERLTALQLEIAPQL